MSAHKQQAGFTLMELMIAVGIIGILSAIAYPSYKEYVMKGRRADAKSGLLRVQLAQEKYRANNVSYGTLAQIGLGTSSPDNHYTIAVANPSATNYTATATPTGLQTGDSCGTFAANMAGKTTSASVQTTDAKVSECWGQ